MKGISPMIATVLLIAFTIGVGGLVTIFFTGLTKTQTGIVSQNSQNFTQCSFGLLEIKKVDCSTTTDGLVGYWKFESVNSTNFTSDVSGNGNDGKLVGFPCNPATCNLTAGVYGNALDFDGVSNAIKLNSGSNANVVGDITVEAWVKPTLGVNSVVVHKDVQYSLLIRGGTGFVTWADSSLWDYNPFGNNNIGIQANQWQHLAATKTGGVVRLYLNGQEKFSKSFGGPLTSTNNITHIGCYSENDCVTYFFNGTIDEVRIYNRALSASEINQHYQNGVALRVLMANNGPVNLGSNFTLTYIVGGVANSTYVNLTSSLSLSSVGILSVPNITNSGSLSQVIVNSLVCPTVQIKKDVSGIIC